VDEFLKKIHFFILCPGARNQAFLKIEGIKNRLDFHFDERAAAFEALGFSKLTNKPCAIITTSGTAVGETLPAIMEAYHSNTKLVVISYDRPERLKVVYAPQTTHQERCLSPFIRSTSFEDDLYPKHINIKSDLETKSITLPKRELQIPLIIISEKTSLTMKQYLELLKKECFIHQEITSPFFQIRTNLEILDDDHLDKLYMQGFFSQVIRLGSIPNCGVRRKLERTINPPEVFHSTEEDVLGLSFGSRLDQDLANVFNTLPPKSSMTLPKNKSETIINNFPASEIFLLKNIIIQNDKENTIFYFGNSLTIRNAKHCSIKNAKIQVSRGLNGIDGQISTAIGIAKATTKNVVAIVGDQTFMYDANILFRTLPDNFHLYIINNGGGEIFKKFTFDAKMSNKHDTVFSKLFKLPKNITEIRVSEVENKKLWSMLSEY